MESINNQQTQIKIYNNDILEEYKKEESLKDKSPLLKLPDYIIELYIFPYLSWEDLFFKMRLVHPDFQEIVKSNWCNIIKEEMCNQLKNLTFLYEKDALTKAYEFKLQYLLNYRNLLLLYNMNSNIMVVLQSCLDFLQNQNIYQLLSTFFGILGQKQCLDILYDENLDINNKKQKIIDIIKTDQLNEDYKLKMKIILDINSIVSDTEVFKELNDDFTQINREDIENLNENCRLIYSFLQGILEYQNLKKNVQELKLRLNELFTKIQNETQLWPKRKKFFENAYKILLYSKSTQFQFRYMNKLFNIYSVKSPLCEFKDESYKSMIKLKNDMENKKEQIMQRLNSENSESLMDEVNDILFKNIIERRCLLIKKILLTEKFFEIYTTSFELMSDKKSCKINQEIIPISEILNIFLLISHAYPDEINEKSFLKIFSVKKDLESVKNIREINKNIIALDKKKKIEKLKKQKEDLIYYQQKKEQILNILKKYMILKENFFKNKKKYKSILYILNKVKNKNNDNFQYMDKIERLLDGETLNDDFDINDIEKLKNFEVNENLLKGIEKSLLLSFSLIIKDYLKNKENEETNENNNNCTKYINNNIIRNSNRNINLDEDEKE